MSVFAKSDVVSSWKEIARTNTSNVIGVVAAISGHASGGPSTAPWANVPSNKGLADGGACDHSIAYLRIVLGARARNTFEDARRASIASGGGLGVMSMRA